jgi:hypothetical protein
MKQAGKNKTVKFEFQVEDTILDPHPPNSYNIKIQNVQGQNMDFFSFFKMPTNLYVKSP